jgi:hypothetical protein
MTRRIVSQETEATIVRMYGEGAKLAAIEKATGVPRASIYLVLERNGQAPKRRDSYMGNDRATIASLYEMLASQQRYIEELEQLLEQYGIDVDER